MIVVGVDGSESSWRAAAYAAGLARRHGALLVLVYVQPRHVVAVSDVVMLMAETASQLADEIAARLHDAAKRIPVRWKFHTFRGDPFGGLVRVADDLRADAVVVGASEHVNHRIMGSLAVRLVKAARWPVTVVP